MEVNRVSFYARITFASFLIPLIRYGLIDSSVSKSIFNPSNSESSLSILTRQFFIKYERRLSEENN
jgi:hypothetical protein